MDGEFEERFLQCFGLGDGDVASKKEAVRRMDTEVREEEKAKQLKEQRKNSPW